MNKDVNDELSCCPVFKEMVDAFYAPCPTIENMRHQAERVSVLSKKCCGGKHACISCTAGGGR